MAIFKKSAISTIDIESKEVKSPLDYTFKRVNSSYNEKIDREWRIICFCSVCFFLLLWFICFQVLSITEKDDKVFVLSKCVQYPIEETRTPHALIIAFKNKKQAPAQKNFICYTGLNEPIKVIFTRNITATVLRIGNPRTL